jgi:hypothetical protein
MGTRPTGFEPVTSGFIDRRVGRKTAANGQGDPAEGTRKGTKLHLPLNQLPALRSGNEELVELVPSALELAGQRVPGSGAG